MIKKAIFDKKNVLVIGGAGFIGSHLCDELIKTSKVICIDNFLTGDEKNIDHLLAEQDFEFIRHDIIEPIELEKLPELQKFKIEFQGVQEIYNLACPMSIKNFDKNNISTILSNSLGVKNALDLAVKYDAKFLHYSSSVIYGPRNTENTKVDEMSLGRIDTVSDRSSYDEGKRFAESLVDNYRKAYNIDTKIMRLFRVYGPRMKFNDNQMIPDIINNALENKDVNIFGDENFSTALCYISDCIDASLKLMKSDIYEPINIGSDVDIKLSKVANIIINILSSKSQIAYVDENSFYTPLSLPDISFARERLGWIPIVTIEKGLEKTVNSMRASKGLKGMNSVI